MTQLAIEMDRCRDLRPSLVAFVVGSADPPIVFRLERHLSDGCANCAQEVERLMDALQAVPLALGPQPLIAGGGALLAKTVGATSQAEQIVPIVYPETRERRLGLALLIFFGIALAAAAFWGRTVVEELEDVGVSLRAERTRTRDVIGQYRDLQARSARIDVLLDAVTNPRISSHDLPEGLRGTRVRAFVDLEADSLILSITALPGEAPFTVQWRAESEWTDLGRVADAEALQGGAFPIPLPPEATLPAALRLIDATSTVVIEGPLEPPP